MNKGSQGRPDPALIAVRVGICAFLVVSEGGVLEVVTNFIQAGKSLQKLEDGVWMALAAGEGVLLVDALVSWLNQNIICQSYSVPILV